ncbi:unnamed protein product [Cylindrotheca closterium]|uniref:Alpha-ketoglutarate-dependent dioxygenase FTO n=1 Tax=Cylindrotheca closterium TaxID=2856 RepID=A0AAD2CQ10_9STRA|nr:unnamed protein product [Cylindrotheca closterium]
MGKKRQRKGDTKTTAKIKSANTPPHSFQSVESKPSNPQYPLPFPKNLPIPSDDFLKNAKPYKESFRQALETSYEGFVVDESIYDEQRAQNYLQQMLDDKLFRRDVTQPFGLGTKCAKTYVTRCVLGEQGTTYKYLGLRMFAHPWDNTEIQKLGAKLTQRTQHHLKELSELRAQRNAPATRGRSNFDICLINRMEAYDDLKPEPTMGNMKASVSWHADSSLEQYSTIAVYQTLIPPKNSTSNNDGQWYVALRVAHDSEGPQASRRGKGIESSIIKETPPIAASLPSGSAYYLLDDFNHHHQHTVLTTGDIASAGVRYSCTFRLLRDSHNVDYHLLRCQTTCSNFHKKGSKLWRSEQLLLTELESEWIRQFYIQGSQHLELLWPAWKEPMQKLLRFWTLLENRTRQVVTLLKAAAEERCGVGTYSDRNDDKPSRKERKAKERRKKALACIEDLLTRSSLDEHSALENIYEPLAEVINERAVMRELWQKREKDHVFRELGPECRPMDVPFQFNVPEGTKQVDEYGMSPIDGTPNGLKQISEDLRVAGRAYLPRKASDLPKPEENQDSESTKESNDHAKGLDWEGWATSNFCLELQEPWALAVVQGKKPIETRAYTLPLALIGKRIMILQSPAGKAGVSSMSDVIDISGSNSIGPRVIGWCEFGSVREYTNQEDFEADEKLHLVTPESGYGWKKDETKVVYGWVVSKYGEIKDSEDSIYISATRRMRSLFQLRARETKKDGKPNGSTKKNRNGQDKNQKKKRRRY